MDKERKMKKEEDKKKKLRERERIKTGKQFYRFIMTVNIFV